MALNSFVFEMQVSANDGDLQRLQAQLSQWESQITSNNITQADADHLGFKPSVQEKEEVYCILNRPYPHSDADHKPADLVSLMLNRLMIQAARKDQVHVVRYILQERGWSISRIAIGRAVGTYSFGVLECFQEHGWDINEPVREHQCSMLRHVVNNETRVRWFLEHGADPNAQNAGKNLDVLSHAGAYASLSTLKLLAAYGANFRQSNALHRAAEGGLHANSEEECIGVLQWLLQDSISVSINQREFEFSGMNMWEEMSSATALHCAVRANALSCARFLLASGIDTGLKDKRGRSARDLGMELGHGEAVRVLDELVGPAMELADS